VGQKIFFGAFFLSFWAILGRAFFMGDNYLAALDLRSFTLNLRPAPISGTENGHVHARCISRTLIGALPLEGQLPRPKYKEEQKGWAVESRRGKNYGPKSRCEKHLGGVISHQPARFGQPRPL
jgi:hypothetical protein